MDSDSSDSVDDNRLGKCEVCSKSEARYTCPSCEVKTCSLRCCKIHKKEVSCTGIRNKARFIPINKYSNLDLASDYRLLEEAARVVETSRKGSVSCRFGLKRAFLKLQQEALKRNITLKFLPSSFKRHVNNTTRYNNQKKSIEWHVDWVFVNGDNWKVSEIVEENARISAILHKYLVKQEDGDVQEKLQFYQAVDLPGIKILLKAEQKSGKKFYEIDPTSTLGEVLRNKIVIEYPTIHLVLKDQVSCYDVIDSDDEDEKELQRQQKSGQEVINKLIKKSESDGSLYESLKNLLFISEYSDEELD